MPPPTIQEEETPAGNAPSGKTFFMRYLRGGLRRKRHPESADATSNDPVASSENNITVDTESHLGEPPAEPDETSPANSTSFAQELAAELEAARLESTQDSLRHTRRNSLQRWDSLHRGNSVSSLQRGNSVNSLHRGNSFSSLQSGSSLNRGNSTHSTNPFYRGTSFQPPLQQPNGLPLQTTSRPFLYRGNSHSSSVLSTDSPRVDTAISRWPDPPSDMSRTIPDNYWTTSDANSGSRAVDLDDFQALSVHDSQFADPDTAIQDSVDVRRVQSTSANAALGAPFHPRRRSATATTALGNVPVIPPLTRVQSLARPSPHVSPKANISPSASLRSQASPTDNVSLASDITTLNRSPRSSIKRSLGPFGGLTPSPWSPTPAEAAELGIITSDDVSLARYRTISSRDDVDDRSSYHSRLVDDENQDSPSHLRSHSYSNSFVSADGQSDFHSARRTDSQSELRRDSLSELRRDSLSDFHRDSQSELSLDNSSHASHIDDARPSDDPNAKSDTTTDTVNPQFEYPPESMYIHYDQYTGQYVYLPYATQQTPESLYYPYMYPGNPYTVPYYTPPQFSAASTPFTTPYTMPTHQQQSYVPQKKRPLRATAASLPPRASLWDPAFTSKANVISVPGYVPLQLEDALSNSNIPQNLPEIPTNARFFVIKSVGEEDIHKSVKYSIWTSTELGNKRLDAAFRSFQSSSDVPIFLFFSVNGSGHFCGVAQMTSQVNENLSSTVWSSDKFKGIFQVRWLMLKDAPFSLFRHVKLTNTPELKPLSSSRDTQEVPSASAHEFLSAFSSYETRTCLLQDVPFYDMQESN